MQKKDLILLFADLDAENAVTTLIDKRQESLQIRSITYDKIRHQMRDSGCCREAGAMLQSFLVTHTHAMVFFDHHGSGRDSRPASKLQLEVENDLVQRGWHRDEVACIVFEPELENWVWVNSVHVAEALGFGKQANDLKRYLHNSGMIGSEMTKPPDPKTAVEHCLRRAKKPRSARFYSNLAELVSLSSCIDPSFDKFKTNLRRWFPPS
ncbi:MAG: hypothetical protein QNJ97_04400 [Myxococcota bacterium]|nr:hypothetical protein [Myxococcota bacterium]